MRQGGTSAPTTCATVAGMKLRSAGTALIIATVCAIPLSSRAVASLRPRQDERATVAVNAVAIPWCSNSSPPCETVAFLVKVRLRMRGNGVSQKIVTTTTAPEARVSVAPGDYNFKIKEVLPGPGGLSVMCVPPAPITASAGKTTYVTVQCVWGSPST